MMQEINVNMASDIYFDITLASAWKMSFLGILHQSQTTESQ